MSGPYEDIRQEIDIIDHEILSLLSKRALLGIRIGEIKKERGEPVYVPEREAQIISALIEANQGPLDNKAIKTIFGTIIENIRSLE